MRVEKSIEVTAPLRQVYNQWTQFEEFPNFMAGVIEVRQLEDDRLHWKADVGGKTKEWTARIVRQQPDEVVAWESEEGAPNSGEVRFRRLADDLTEIDLDMEFDPEDFQERVGASLGIADKRIEGDLLRFKDFIERRDHETGAWRGEIGESEVAPEGTIAAGSAEAEALRRASQEQPGGRSPADIGQTVRSDISREGLSQRDPGGRGAMAYGGHGDVGAGRSSLGGEGRSSEGGPLGGERPGAGGLGREGRGSEGMSPGGAFGGGGPTGQTSGMGGFPEDMPLSDTEARARHDAATSMGDVGLAGGAGALNEEDRLADQGLLDPGGPGRESQSTAGPEGSNETGPAGTDRPVDYRGEARPGSTDRQDEEESEGRR